MTALYFHEHTLHHRANAIAERRIKETCLSSLQQTATYQVLHVLLHPGDNLPVRQTEDKVVHRFATVVQRHLDYL